MEMHLVHANASGEILVVGLMVEEGLTANTLIDKVWLNFPGDTEKEHETISSININDVIPVAKGYYNYIGSLTTPPCSMGLQWIVMKETLKLSATQINQFRAKYDHNYRPVQKLNNRVVYEKI
jgi:carbonic anhydrase